MLEAQVHSQLRDFLRNQQDSPWRHHLTMARMVARGLRLKRSTIIQTGVNHEEYFPSYITPALLSDSSVVIVTDKTTQKRLIQDKIPLLQQSLNNKSLITNKCGITLDSTSTVFVIDYQTWLDKLFKQLLDLNMTTIITEAEKLPDMMTEYLSQEITSQQWYQLAVNSPKYQHIIRDKLAKLTKLIYAHPPNPYESYLLDEEEITIINDICNLIKDQQPNYDFEQFIEFQKLLLSHPDYISYFKVNRSQASFTIKVSPLELKSSVSNLWSNHNLILLANYLEPQKYPVDYSDKLGLNLENFTCLKFSPSAQNNSLKIYFTKNLPFPNSPHFFPRVNQEILALVGAIKINHHPIIIIINELPLQGQITTSLAAQFGSRVKLNSPKISNNTILVCDMGFWLNNQMKLRSPQLLIIPTLPIPSLENPLISAQVTYYKNSKKDWFRLFLLPYTIKILQQAVTYIRNNDGVLALLDNRVNNRSYGTKILQALEPYGKINYLDLDWLNK